MRTNHDREYFEKNYDADVIIIGGGVAGVVAAIAAARLGVKTLLIHNRPVLGGVSSSECVPNSNGSHVTGAAEYVNREARETGIMEELRLEARYLEANGWASHWSIVLQVFCEREKKLTVLLNTEVFEVETMNDEIKSLTGRTIGSEITLKARAPLFIDCSGDSFPGFAAGADYRMGRESRGEFNESLAPEKSDDKTMGSSVLFGTKDMGKPMPFKAPSWAYKIESDDDLPYRIHGNPRNGWWWLECGGDMDTIKDNEIIYRTMLSLLFGIWDHVKNSGGHDADNLVINWVSHMTGKRESRRLMGDVILNQNDVTKHTDFPDTVAYGGWPIDIHPPEGVFGKSHPGSMPPFIFPGIYHIPFRCLYSRNIKNLMMAGRNISVSHIALGTTRLTATCALCGQAVGTAAYLCKKLSKTPKEIGKEHISELQKILAINDIEIPGRHFHIPENLPTGTCVSASSSQVLKIVKPDSFLPLIPLPKNTEDPCDVPPDDRSRAQMFPVSTSRIESVDILFSSDSHEPVKVTARLRRAKTLNDFSSIEDLAVAVAEVPYGKETRTKFKFDVETERDSLYWVSIVQVKDVSVLTSSYYLPGICMKADGCYFDNSNFCFEVFPEQNIFLPENVINGVRRATNWPNIWLSDAEKHMPQFIEIDFQKIIEFNCVELIFDTNLNRLIRLGAAPECVRDYELIAISGNDSFVLEKIEGNYQRCRIHEIPKTISAEKLRLVITATNGDVSARVYEIRVFKK